MPTVAQNSSPVEVVTPLDESRATRLAPLLLLLAPLDCLVLAILTGAEILGRVLRRTAPSMRPSFSPPQPQCSFVLLSWNSQSMLTQSLPPLMEALKSSGGDHEVIVVDNHSTDGTDEYIRRRFPGIRLVSSRENVYFGSGMRLGIRAATRDILVVMNSDVVVHPGFLEPLLRSFYDTDVFGVAAAVSSEDGAGSETGNTHARFNGHEVEWEHDRIACLNKETGLPVFWLHRGLFAVDRRKYLWLGGLDNLYDPIHMEDVDLSYRAWKVGWRCLLFPQSRISHIHQLNVPSAGEGFVHMIVRRNQHIFLWKNINDLSMLTSNLLHSSRTRMLRARMPEIGVWREAHSFLAAFKRLPVIVARRLCQAPRIIRTDREVFLMTAANIGGS
jgi:GT2 family glycosyltransferase